MEQNIIIMFMYIIFCSILTIYIIRIFIGIIPFNKFPKTRRRSLQIKKYIYEITPMEQFPEFDNSEKLDKKEETTASEDKNLLKEYTKNSRSSKKYWDNKFGTHRYCVVKNLRQNVREH